VVGALGHLGCIDLADPGAPYGNRRYVGCTALKYGMLLNDYNIYKVSWARQLASSFAPFRTEALGMAWCIRRFGLL
jgi:hypothetical protein